MATETKALMSERTTSDHLTAAAGWIARWIILVVLAGLIVVPIAYAALGGFKDNFQLSVNPIALPNPWISSNYTDVLASGSFWQQLGNSLLIATVTTVTVVAFAALAAFVFARR